MNIEYVLFGTLFLELFYEINIDAIFSVGNGADDPGKRLWSCVAMSTVSTVKKFPEVHSLVKVKQNP